MNCVFIMLHYVIMYILLLVYPAIWTIGSGDQIIVLPSALDVSLPLRQGSFGFAGGHPEWQYQAGGGFTPIINLHATNVLWVLCFVFLGNWLLALAWPGSWGWRIALFQMPQVGFQGIWREFKDTKWELCCHYSKIGCRCLQLQWFVSFAVLCQVALLCAHVEGREYTQSTEHGTDTS